MVGFATWNLPKPDAPKKKDRDVEEVKKSRGFPEIPGVKTELWNEKVDGPKEAYMRDVEESEDICGFRIRLHGFDLGDFKELADMLQYCPFSSSTLIITARVLVLCSCSGGCRRRMN